MSLWRDSEKYIEKSLRQIEGIENELKDEYSLLYSFYENDSIDNTPSLLNNWLKKRNGNLISEINGYRKWGSQQSKQRTKTLAKYRNICLRELIKKDFDFLLILDSDIIYESIIIRDMINLLHNRPKIGMVTANTMQSFSSLQKKRAIDFYYDSWALVDKRGNPGLTYRANPFLLDENRKAWENGQIINVNSAFGGAALTRSEIIKEKDVIWDGEKGCEHWSFCERIRSQNYLIVVDPKIKAYTYERKSSKPDIFLLLRDNLRIKLADKCNNKRKIDVYINLLIKGALNTANLLLMIKRLISTIIRYIQFKASTIDQSFHKDSTKSM